MRRRSAHLAFAAATLLCGAGVLTQGLRLRQVIATNRAIGASVQWAASPPAEERALDPHIALAHAAALSKAGHFDAALRGFNALQVRGADDDVSRAAAFDSGNLYLRQGLHDAGNPAVFLPLLELAKQRYRDLLRADPSDWDARFNLERALRFAPEDKEAFEQPDDRPVERPPNKLPDLLAPDLP